MSVSRESRACDCCGKDCATRVAVVIDSAVAMVGSSCARRFRRARPSDLIRSLDRGLSLRLSWEEPRALEIEDLGFDDKSDIESRLGLKLGDFLGCGSSGCAFQYSGGVVKLTQDKGEVANVRKVLDLRNHGVRLDGIVNYHSDIQRIRNKEKRYVHYYFRDYVKKVEFSDTFITILGTKGDTQGARTKKAYLSAIKFIEIRFPKIAQSALELAKFGLYVNVEWHNIGVNRNGDFVLFDFSSVPVRGRHNVDNASTSATVEEHQGAHAAPDQRDAPLWDLTGGKIYPDDVYLFGQRYYGIGDGSDSRAWNIASAYHNRPLRRITIYRAVPKGLKGVKILPGDWVTIDRRYATQHGRSNLRNEYRVISKLVQAGDLFTDGNSIME